VIHQGSLFETDGDRSYTVRAIPKKDTHYLLLNVHYARRVPSIVHAYGLFLGEQLMGVITYGIPASPSLCTGVCGEQHRAQVLELNRLCLVENNPNEASMLVGKSLAMLPPGRVVVSYADTDQKHLGVIYQATNFLYTGCNKPRVDWAIRGLEHMHPKAISNMVEGAEKRIEALKEKFGDDFYYRQRSVKHRYITFTGSKSDKRYLRSQLRYETLPYPKTKIEA
jgi:hypothetical protein